MFRKQPLYEINTRYITCGIGEQYKEWKISNDNMKASARVFLDSPTGTGKTYFLTEILLKYAVRENRGIVYVCNRSGLRDQIINDLRNSDINLIEMPTNGQTAFFSFKYPNSDNYIILFNYQAATLSRLYNLYCKDINNVFDYPATPESFLNSIKFPIPYYVFFDEVHFFLDDAHFNPHTNTIFENLMRFYNYQVQIFTSATMKDFFYFYLQKYCNFIKAEDSLRIVKQNIYDPHIEYYLNKYSLEKIYNIIFFTEEQFLLDEIKKSDENEKWLVFISNKDRGSELRIKIAQRNNRKSTIMLSSEKKDSNLWHDLTKKEQFEEDILLTTNVIYNGVSILDDQLKNIVIPFTSYTEFMQRLGRKRFGDNTPKPINLYVQIPTIKTIRRIIFERNSELDKFQQLQKPLTIQEKVGIIRYDSKKIGIKYDLYVSNQTMQFYTNPLAEKYLYDQLYFYGFLEKYNFLGYALYKRVLSAWLGNSISEFVNIPVNISLDKFLENHLNQPIEDQEGFYKNFFELYSEFCAVMLETERITDKNLNIFADLSKRKGREKGTINQALKNIRKIDASFPPYAVKKKNNAWVVFKEETTPKPTEQNSRDPSEA